MNWGKKIALSYSLFVILMLSLTVACFMQKDLFLVSDDYYQQEVNYQVRIDNTQNAEHLKEAVSISQNEENGELEIDLTEESKGAVGTITFYRPSNPTLDIVFPVNLSKIGTQKIKTEKLQKGLWLVKVDWQKGGVSYYKEQKIQI